MKIESSLRIVIGTAPQCAFLLTVTTLSLSVIVTRRSSVAAIGRWAAGLCPSLRSNRSCGEQTSSGWGKAPLECDRYLSRGRGSARQVKTGEPMEGDVEYDDKVWCP